MGKWKFVALLAAMTMLVAGMLGCSGEKPIKFNGYYSNKQHLSAVPIFFRFYPDGTVTAALPPVVNGVIQFTPGQLDNTNAKECTIRGKYVLDRNKVAFRLVDRNGTADFSGDFTGRSLTLKSHSNINGKDATESYEFYAW
ncbi:MAG TPA: hypothetical protein VI298_02975 [Geobacteraceae bacterium]